MKFDVFDHTGQFETVVEGDNLITAVTDYFPESYAILICEVPDGNDVAELRDPITGVLWWQVTQRICYHCEDGEYHTWCEDM